MREGEQLLPVDDVAVDSIVGFGTRDDLESRHALKDLLNETLGWTGLGDCNESDADEAPDRSIAFAEARFPGALACRWRQEDAAPAEEVARCAAER